MKIQLLHDYQGRPTDEKLLPAGEYTDADLPVRVLRYLVDNGHAELIESVDEPEPDTPTSDTPDYHNMSLNDLRALLPDDADEDAIYSNPDAHWTQRRDELADWLIEHGI